MAAADVMSRAEASLSQGRQANQGRDSQMALDISVIVELDGSVIRLVTRPPISDKSNPVTGPSEEAK